MNARQRQLRHLDYIEHMLEAAVQARAYVKGIPEQNFLSDTKTQDAVILKLIVIGEAATQVMDEAPDFAGVHPEVPWRQLRGMRNRMAHGYFEIDMDIVWATVTESLPELEEHLRRILTPPPSN